MQRAALERMLVNAQAAPFLPWPRRARGGILHELDGEDHAALANLGDMRMIPQVLHAREHVRGGGAIAFQHRLVAKYRQRGVRGGAGQRIAGVAVGMQKRVQLAVLIVERVVDRIGGEHHGQRQVAAGESFRQAQIVRPDAGLLAGEHRAGAAEPHRDLIGDEMYPYLSQASRSSLR